MLSTHDEIEAAFWRMSQTNAQQSDLSSFAAVYISRVTCNDYASDEKRQGLQNDITKAFRDSQSPELLLCQRLSRLKDTNITWHLCKILEAGLVIPASQIIELFLKLYVSSYAVRKRLEWIHRKKRHLFELFYRVCRPCCVSADFLIHQGFCTDGFLCRGCLGIPGPCPWRAVFTTIDPPDAHSLPLIVATHGILSLLPVILGASLEYNETVEENHQLRMICQSLTFIQYTFISALIAAHRTGADIGPIVLCSVTGSHAILSVDGALGALLDPATLKRVSHEVLLQTFLTLVPGSINSDTLLVIEVAAEQKGQRVRKFFSDHLMPVLAAKSIIWFPANLHTRLLFHRTCAYRRLAILAATAGIGAPLLHVLSRAVDNVIDYT